MLWLAKFRYGRERAAASALDVKVEEDGGLEAVVGLLGTPTAPDMLGDWPCLGACCFLNCKALARAFS